MDRAPSSELYEEGESIPSAPVTSRVPGELVYGRRFTQTFLHRPDSADTLPLIPSLSDRPPMAEGIHRYGASGGYW